MSSTPPLCRTRERSLAVCRPEWTVLPAHPAGDRWSGDQRHPQHLAGCGWCRSAAIGCLRSGCGSAVLLVDPWLRVLARRVARALSELGARTYLQPEDVAAVAHVKGLRLLREDDRLRPERTLDDEEPSGYLYTCMRHAGISLLRPRHVQRHELLAEVRDEDDPGPSLEEVAADSATDGVIDAVVDADAARRLVRAVKALRERLDERQRAVLDLWWPGVLDPDVALTQREIAARTPVSQSTVCRWTTAWAGQLLTELGGRS